MQPSQADYVRDAMARAENRYLPHPGPQVQRESYGADPRRCFACEPAPRADHAVREGYRYADTRVSQLQRTPPARWTTHEKDDGWRYFAPFALIVIIVLLFLFRYVNSGPGTGAMTWPETCAKGYDAYQIMSGDTCWSIAADHDRTVDQLIGANPGMDCDRLMAGKQLCIAVR